LHFYEFISLKFTITVSISIIYCLSDVFRHKYSVHQVLSILEDDSDFFANASSADIFISPPTDPTCSDEDSGDEDTGGSYNNLTSKQLLAEADVSVRKPEGRHHLEDDNEDNCDGYGVDGSGDTETLDQGAKRDLGKKHHRAKPTPRQWMKKDMPLSKQHLHEDPPANIYAGRDLTPQFLFELFFDDEVIATLIANSEKYALQKGKHGFQVTAGEFRLFMAILFSSGYASLPRRRMYWELSDDVRNIAISRAMTRNRFEELLRYLHCSDNEDLDSNDKTAKVRPLIRIMNEKFLTYFPKCTDLSIDESMLPYYGRHSMKQFIRGKPIRFGYKVWSLNTPVGYCIQFEPYQGRGVTDPQLGLGGSVVVDLIAELPPARYSLYFDNFFTSLKLLDKLSEMSIGGTGTIRVNRIEKCPLTAAETLKKSPRGSSDFRYDQKSGILIVRWNDNSVVTIASNCHGVEPLGQAHRWSQAAMARTTISQPNLIHQYNSNMGGVDRMDQNISQYRISIRSKKWWWPFFAYCLDVAMQNAWLIYRQTASHRQLPLDQLEFRRTVCNAYFSQYRPTLQSIPKPKELQKGRIRGRILHEIRFDGLNHFVAKGRTQRRCALCAKKVTHVCKKCDVGLHVRCFVEYHSK
jgi:DNA excision repair protein ERCC-6